VTRIALKPEGVDAIAFWTRKSLSGIDRLFPVDVMNQVLLHNGHFLEHTQAL
jgi:hypothetical protein